MNKEHIPVITDKEELYDKCENMEQLFDKYYLPLLDKHFSKVYQLQQENQKLKEHIEKYDNYCKTTGIKELVENQKYKEVIDKAIEILEEVKERRIMLLDEEKVLDILKEVE